ncbi:MAG: type II toxin-antitoxin system VapC family toxin [Bacillota bacterium]
MGAKKVCVDASLVLKLVLNEPDSGVAEALFACWQAEGKTFVVPAFCPAEVDSVLRRKTVVGRRGGRLTPEQAEAAFEAAQAIPLKTVAHPKLRRRAWELARELGLPVVYDSYYLAVAELNNCEFWTADEKLARAVRPKINYLHLLNEFLPPPEDQQG